MSKLKLLLPLLFMMAANGAAAGGAPKIVLGDPENYCVTYCYLRIPFTVENWDPARKIGRVFCDLEADVTSKLPVYNGEARTRSVAMQSIGVFKSDAKGTMGDVELHTGIQPAYFVKAKLKKADCHF